MRWLALRWPVLGKPIRAVQSVGERDLRSVLFRRDARTRHAARGACRPPPKVHARERVSVLPSVLSFLTLCTDQAQPRFEGWVSLARPCRLLDRKDGLPNQCGGQTVVPLARKSHRGFQAWAGDCLFPLCPRLSSWLSVQRGRPGLLAVALPRQLWYLTARRPALRRVFAGKATEFRAANTRLKRVCRFSSAVEQRFCKPKVGSSILSTGTNEFNNLFVFVAPS
jgi:hypothetical protein